jgi:pimeloyl-ACP methyl ester carboxylesterase
MTEDVRRQLKHIEHTCDDPGERRRRQHQARSPLYSCDLLADEDEPERAAFDLRAHTETWNDMMSLQERGVYPRAFQNIRSPILMLHGDFDPHPGTMIRDSLLAYLPQLEFHELESCGHEPWREKAARDQFFELTRDWLDRALRVIEVEHVE